MFTDFNLLNEAGFQVTPDGCKKNELREGANPKVPERNGTLSGWASGKNRSHKNARWEQLRR